MAGFDGKAFGAEIVSVVKDYLAREISAVAKRLDGIEGRLATLPVPTNGKDADEDAVVARVSEKMASELKGLRAVVEGIKIPEIPELPELPDIGKMIEEAVSPIKLQMEQGRELFESVSDTVKVSLAEVKGDTLSAEAIKELVNEGVSAGLKQYRAVADSEKPVIDDVMPALMKRIDDGIAAIPTPKDGRDADPAVVRRMVEEAVSEAVKAIPAPKDGENGSSVSIDDVMPQLKARVDEYLSGIPVPKDGLSVTVDDVAPLIASEIEKRVSELPGPKDGRDGLDIKDMFRAEGGKLIAVMSDGTTRDLGVFVGKDGKDADMVAIEKSIAEKVDAIPHPKDGKDGFSLKHFDADLMEDGRTVVLKFQDGSDTGYSVELGIPAMIYRGVFKDGQSYERGDTVTWGGSLWHCDVPATTSKPDGAEKHWTLAAKKGRDGRDSVVKTQEPAKVKI